MGVVSSMAKGRLHLLHHVHLLNLLNLLHLLHLLLPLFIGEADACTPDPDPPSKPDPGIQIPDPIGPPTDPRPSISIENWGISIEDIDTDCPENKPTMGTDCTTANDVTCSYGEEHCCGKTHASFNASCDPHAGWTGFKTDACLKENCGGATEKRCTSWIGPDKWCQLNCNLEPPNCPPAHCRCLPAGFGTPPPR